MQNWRQVGLDYPQVPRAASPPLPALPARLNTAPRRLAILDSSESYFNAAKQLQATENLFLSHFIHPGNLYHRQPACHDHLEILHSFFLNLQTHHKADKMQGCGREGPPPGPRESSSVQGARRSPLGILPPACIPGRLTSWRLPDTVISPGRLETALAREKQV